MLKLNPYVTDTGPRKPNVSQMWPAKQKELPTPGLSPPTPFFAHV
jgi:hypothetical protein